MSLDIFEWCSINKNYPDDLWTAPTNKALRCDIELAMSMGFNGARCHQKVFEARYFYHADVSEFLVVSEYPDWDGGKTCRWSTPADYSKHEATRMGWQPPRPWTTRCSGTLPLAG